MMYELMATGHLDAERWVLVTANPSPPHTHPTQQYKRRFLPEVCPEIDRFCWIGGWGVEGRRKEKKEKKRRENNGNKTGARVLWLIVGAEMRHVGSALEG